MSPTLRTVWRLVAGQRLRYGASVAALITASCFLYLAPLIPQAVLDGVLVEPAGGASRATRAVLELLGGAERVARNLWLPAGAFVLLSGLAGAFTHLRTRWAAGASEGIVRSLRDRVYDHLQRLPLKTLDGAETGDLIQRCTSDVETVRKFLADQVVEIGRALVMFAVPLPLMLAIDGRMTLASVLLIPFVVAYSFFAFGRIKSAFTAADEAEGRMTTRIQENLTGIRVVRAFARQGFERSRFRAANSDHRALDFRLYALLARFWALSDLLCFLQKGLVVAAGTWLMLRGELGVGAFFYFLTAVSMFIWPVRHMGRILTDLGKAQVALGRVEEILAEPLEQPPAASSNVESLGGGLVFDQVRFAHGEQPVLQGVSFSVGAGETLALIGPSGSGKSTIVELLLRLRDGYSGSIRLGGRELSSLERELVRGQTAVVHQEPFLFSKTIRENLRLGRASASAEEVEAAARTACIHEAVLGLDGGYETEVGERGVTLSGGQRQRLALARALLQRPSLLVLDDSLSAVDTRTERQILTRLQQVRGRETTVVVAHRLSTVQEADRIVVLDEGRVVEQGSHRELLNRGGAYRRLWELQSEPEARPREFRSASESARVA